MTTAVSIKTNDGTMLEADLYGAGTDGVVLVHGKVFDKDSWQDQADALSRAGHLVLVPNLRGYGASDGEQDPAAFPRDVAACVQDLRARGCTEVSVIGASMGAVAAGKAVTSGLVAHLRVLALLSPRAVPAPERLNAGRVAFVASEGEDCFEDVRGFHDAAPEPKSFYTVPGDAHAQFIFRGDHGPALLAHLIDLLSPA